MVVGLAGMLAVITALAVLAIFVWALWDLLQRTSEVWVASGQDRLVWVIVVIFVPLIGPALYLGTAKPRLDQAAHKLHAVSVGIDES